MVTLDIKKRDSNESLNTLRNNGFIPAVFYGPKEATTSISVNAKDFDKAWKTTSLTRRAVRKTTLAAATSISSGYGRGRSEPTINAC